MKLIWASGAADPKVVPILQGLDRSEELGSSRLKYFQLPSFMLYPATTRWFWNTLRVCLGAAWGGTLVIILLHFPSALKVSTSPSEDMMTAAASLHENLEGLFGTYLPPTQLTLGGRFGA